MNKNLGHISKSFVSMLTMMFDNKNLKLKYVETNKQKGSLIYEIIKIPNITIDNLYDKIIEMENDIAADSYLEGVGADFHFEEDKYISTFHFDYFEVF